MITQKEAKNLILELWRYLAEHPECTRAGESCFNDDSPWEEWIESNKEDHDVREKADGRIVEIALAWEQGE
ncbi:MAG: hypothetical protein LBK73_12180 [Treponema sp.]|jgi:hypothetical protein|nr:hypothetical protein [Treponema sp.]